MDYLSFGYAFAIAAGGLIGYLKAGSTASLISGLIFGGLSGLGAYHTSQDPANCALLFGVCGSLGALMSYRAYNSGKFMPAGIVATLSILMVLRLLPRMVAKLN